MMRRVKSMGSPSPELLPVSRSASTVPRKRRSVAGNAALVAVAVFGVYALVALSRMGAARRHKAEPQLHHEADPHHHGHHADGHEWHDHHHAFDHDWEHFDQADHHGGHHSGHHWDEAPHGHAPAHADGAGGGTNRDGQGHHGGAGAHGHGGAGHAHGSHPGDSHHAHHAHGGDAHGHAHDSQHAAGAHGSHHGHDAHGHADHHGGDEHGHGHGHYYDEDPDLPPYDPDLTHWTPYDAPLPDPAEDVHHHGHGHGHAHGHGDGADHPVTLHHPDHAAAKGLYALTARDIDGRDRHLSEFAGKVTLVVNVASHCGFTDANYRGLESVYEKYRPHGLEILAFPCNQFGNQEPGTEAEIKAFVRQHYNVSFPLFSKVDVNGPGAHPVYAFLKRNLPVSEHGGGGSAPGSDLAWNFQKILVDQTGSPVRLIPQAWDQAEVENAVYDALLAGERRYEEWLQHHHTHHGGEPVHEGNGHGDAHADAHGDAHWHAHGDAHADAHDPHHQAAGHEHDWHHEPEQQRHHDWHGEPQHQEQQQHHDWHHEPQHHEQQQHQEQQQHHDWHGEPQQHQQQQQQQQQHGAHHSEV